MKVSGRGESHCRSVGTELPGHDEIEEQVELEDKYMRRNHLEQLVHDVLSVDALEDVALLDHVVEVGLHELEDEVEVLVVGRPVHVQQLDDVRVAAKLFQKDDFPVMMIFSRVGQKHEMLPERALSVSSVAKGIKDLLHSHNCGRFPVRGFPDHAIGALS